MTVVTPSVPASGTAVANTSGQYVSAAVTGGTITGILVLPSPAQPLIAPAVPASTVQTPNNTGAPVAVTVSGGTVTVIAVGGVTSGLTAGTVIVPAGSNIAITYSVAPTWTWQQALAGFHGTSIPSPSSVPLPPNSSITLVYSAAPTWAWTNPPASSYSGGYSGYNTQAEGTGYNPDTLLPYAQHATGGFTGLATGVSN